MNVDEADLNADIPSIVDVGQFVTFVCTDEKKFTQPGSNTSKIDWCLSK